MPFLSTPLNILLMHSKFEPSAGHLAALERAAGGRITVARSEPEAWEGIADADIVIGHRYLRQSLKKAANLRWVQSTSSGVDRLPLADLKAGGVRLTSNLSGNLLVARHAVTLAWAVARNLPLARDRQVVGRWDNAFIWPPLPRRAMVFGHGTIGAEIARLLHNDGIEVHVVVRQPRIEQIQDVTAFYWDERWRDMLPQMDWVFLALPNTADTQHLFDEATLRHMAPRAVLVNVGRGTTVDTRALGRVLESGHLAAAALDVLDPKPTQPDDPFWRTPRLVLTPHVAAHANEALDWFEAFMEAQLNRALTSDTLAAEVRL
ncbi:NAD(P)-dependent oxidoreductase [Actibacterium sp. 188UL27-1]|uniref:NAD(P)-dependent oxidoreductase n=1 Tax=Actibacterium sp. 188UL27-1 TaxID=2786961 RepID=UPI001958181D|nr:NAD(P)-dependent oxidoreductase [Actibacterium sp. 188UL27-1]MBM7066459.1 hypothetical protein [Actibacterium sp. 188UL27-1]